MKAMHLENPCRGGQDYVSPSSKVVEILTEGILCESKNGGLGNLKETDYNDLF